MFPSYFSVGMSDPPGANSDPFRPLGGIMKNQRRFAPDGGRIESESVAGFIGISTPPCVILQAIGLHETHDFKGYIFSIHATKALK